MPQNRHLWPGSGVPIHPWKQEIRMKRKTTLVGLTSAFALAASSALACPYMKQDQVTQAPMSPIASADEPVSSSLATNDLTTLPPLESTTADDAADD